MRIGLIGAMDEEVAMIKMLLSEMQEEEHAGCRFFIGRIDQNDIILLQSGIGKVNAAMGTTLLIQLYSPDILINTGSAGGFNPNLKVGDVVISSEVRYHDVDVTAFNYEYGQVPQLPAAFSPDQRLVSAAKAAARKVTGISVVTGLIATGDSFMSDPERVAFVKGKFPEIQAAEMEAAAMAQVSYQFKIPFVIIRSLSDIAGVESHVSFDQFLETAALNSANLVLNMIKEL